MPRALGLVAVELGDVGGEVGVRGEAVAARVGLGDAERDLLAGGGVDRALAQRTGEAHPAVEDRGAGHRRRHVRCDAERRLDGIEQPLRTPLRAGVLNGVMRDIEASHGALMVSLAPLTLGR